MFAYPVNFIYEPRNSQTFYPRTRNFYQPSRPCSYHYNNAVPLYNFYSPYHYYYAYDDEDDEDQLLQDQLLQEQLRAYKQQQEERERMKRFYEREQRSQQPEESTSTTNNKPKRSFKIKVQGKDDETKSTINKSQAALKIFNFIKNQKANKQTRKILNKLHILCIIEEEFKEVQKTKHLGNLTFDEEHEKQILPISIENKRFLEYEYKIVKLLDKLDGVQSEGADIIREKRKSLVKFAQTLLGELDNEKEKQWKEWKGLKESNEKSDMEVDDTLDRADESNVVEEIDVPAPSSVASENDSEEPGH